MTLKRPRPSACFPKSASATRALANKRAAGSLGRACAITSPSCAADNVDSSLVSASGCNSESGNLTDTDSPPEHPLTNRWRATRLSLLLPRAIAGESRFGALDSRSGPGRPGGGFQGASMGVARYENTVAKVNVSDQTGCPPTISVTAGYDTSLVPCPPQP